MSNLPALLCVRSGSRSVPNKNIRLLKGVPLLAWSVITALEAGLEPWVSSDSQSYLDLAARYGAKTLLRPEQLAKDTTPHIEVIEHEVKRIVPYPTELVLLQCTAPFIRKHDVLGAIEKFRKEDYDSLITVIPIPEQWHPDTALQLVDGRIVMASGVPVKHRIRRRQDHRPAWVPSGNLYIFKTRSLAEGNFYGARVGTYQVPQTVNINSESDLVLAQQLAEVWQI